MLQQIEAEVAKARQEKDREFREALEKLPGELPTQNVNRVRAKYGLGEFYPNSFAAAPTDASQKQETVTRTGASSSGSIPTGLLNANNQPFLRTAAASEAPASSDHRFQISLRRQWNAACSSVDAASSAAASLVGGAKDGNDEDEPSAMCARSTHRWTATKSNVDYSPYSLPQL